MLMAELTRADAAFEILKRRKARKSLISFITYIDPDYIVSDFSISVCAALEQFIEEQARGERPILIIQAPPQHGKSQIVSRYLPAFIFGLNPDLAIGGLSYGKDLASDMNRDVQRIMMGDEYRILFPESSLNSRRVVTIEVEAKRNSETFELVGRSGRYVSQGVGGPLTGKRLDIGIIDDPIKNAQEALSSTVKDGVWNWYITTFITRLSKNSGQIIMATSWATDDLSGRIQASDAKCKTLKFPAIDSEGRALIPELHPIEKLLETKATMSNYFWSAMYQQSPIVLGGGLIKGEWFHRYNILPLIKYRRIYADTAQKTQERHDYSVFQCWGLGVDGKAYMIDQIRGKWEAPDLKRKAVDFWNKHAAMNPDKMGALQRMGVEDKASGTGLVQDIQRDNHIPIFPIQRNKDKYTRVLDIQGYIESGYVSIPENSPFVSDFVAECEAFTADDSHAHDDQIDPMCDAIVELLQSNSVKAWENMI